MIYFSTLDKQLRETDHIILINLMIVPYKSQKTSLNTLYSMHTQQYHITISPCLCCHKMSIK